MVKKFNELFEKLDDVDLDYIQDTFSQKNFPTSVKTNMEVDVSLFTYRSLQTIREWCIMNEYIPSISIIKEFLNNHYNNYFKNIKYSITFKDIIKFLKEHDELYTKTTKVKKFNL
jgi:RNA recognition motif-containing protein